MRRRFSGEVRLFRAGEKHVGGLDASFAAVFDVEDEVVFEDVVGRAEAEFGGGAIDRWGGAFELDEGADGSFVEFDQEVCGPFEARGKLISGAELFVAEPAAQAEAFEDFLQGGGFGDGEFGFFTDFVAAVGGVGGLLGGSGGVGRIFEREE